MGCFKHQLDHVYPHSHLSHQLRSSPAGEVKCQSDRDSNVSWHHRNLNGKTSRADPPERTNVTDLRCLIEICFLWRGVRINISCEEALFFWIDICYVSMVFGEHGIHSKSTFSLWYNFQCHLHDTCLRKRCIFVLHMSRSPKSGTSTALWSRLFQSASPNSVWIPQVWGWIL